MFFIHLPSVSIFHPSLLILFPSGYFLCFSILPSLYFVIICSLLQSWSSIFLLGLSLLLFYQTIILKSFTILVNLLHPVILVAFGFYCSFACFCLRVLLNRHLVDSLELKKVFRGTKSDTACHNTTSLSCKNFAILKVCCSKPYLHSHNGTVINIYSQGSYLRRSCDKDTENAQYSWGRQHNRYVTLWNRFSQSIFRALYHGSHRSFHPPL